MHWLADQINNLEAILQRQSQGDDNSRRAMRDEFIRSVHALVEDIAKREGITASFACHEGLLVESGGAFDDFEALAANGQRLLQSGIAALQSLGFGELTQMVLIGDTMKLALYSKGQIGIGIAASREVMLSKILR